jgi:hypothetical protein
MATSRKGLSSSRARGWSGLYAEIRAHGDLQLSSFVQQTTEVCVLIRGNVMATRRIDGGGYSTIPAKAAIRAMNEPAGGRKA